MIRDGATHIAVATDHVIESFRNELWQGINGLDLQKRIAGDRIDMPIIFITGQGDIPMSVQAMKGGN